MQLNIAQRKSEILLEIQSYFGVGKIYKYNTSMWAVSGAKQIKLVLVELIPHLRIKKSVAELALELCERISSNSHGQSGHLTQEEFNIRMDIVDRIREFNSGHRERSYI